MFERIARSRANDVTVLVDGNPVRARTGDTVAAALLAAGKEAFRVNAADGELRGPWCLMGICYDCRVTIDGQSGAQACAIPVADGMRIELRPARDEAPGEADG